MSRRTRRADPARPSEVFVAHFPGTCAGCGEWFKEGTLVVYQHNQVRHDNCVTPDEEEP